MKRRIAWWWRGQQHTEEALTSLGDDLRALQRRVDDLQRTLEELRAAQQAASDRQLDEFDRVRAAVAAATDDLMARVDAVRGGGAP